MGIKRFFKILNTILKNLEQTYLTNDFVMQSIDYSSKSIVEKSLNCLLKCEK